MIGHGKRIGGLYYLKFPIEAVRDEVAKSAVSKENKKSGNGIVT